MKILLLGKNGQVGWELQRSLAPLGELIALDRHSSNYCGDLSQPKQLSETIQQLQPDWIVNAAAYTAVDKAETETALAHTINAEAPAAIAQAAQQIGARLLHYSTDYVFNGSGEQAWQETDPVEPLSVYGASKLAGEQAIQATGCQHLIFRTSWVYAARGANFAKTMLRLAQQRDSLSVINDQIGAPTGAELLADVSAHALRLAQANRQLTGIYHLAASGQTSWYDYARFVLEYAEQAGISLTVKAEAIQAIPTSAYPTPAQRPLNSRLNCSKLEQQFALGLPAWQQGVSRMLQEILEP